MLHPNHQPVVACMLDCSKLPVSAEMITDITCVAECYRVCQLCCTDTSEKHTLRKPFACTIQAALRDTRLLPRVRPSRTTLIENHGQQPARGRAMHERMITPTMITMHELRKNTKADDRHKATPKHVSQVSGYRRLHQLDQLEPALPPTWSCAP